MLHHGDHAQEQQVEGLYMALTPAIHRRRCRRSPARYDTCDSGICRSCVLDSAHGRAGLRTGAALVVGFQAFE